MSLYAGFFNYAVDSRLEELSSEKNQQNKYLKYIFCSNYRQTVKIT